MSKAKVPWLEKRVPDVLQIGEAAPGFTLPCESGEMVSLGQFKGKQPVLIFFYPADFTPVCTAEVCAFRDDFERFVERNVAILGISADAVEKHRRFHDECRVPFPLLSDVDLEVARQYGARGLLGMRRAYYLVGIDGSLLWQHAEILPIFKLSNTRILETIDAVLKVTPPGKRPALPARDTQGSQVYAPPPQGRG